MDIDAIVIGAGAVGLAVAVELARKGRETIILEAASAIGTGTSSRNSEVIHAGIYYPTGTLKHRLCVAGRRKLYQWTEERSVAHRKTGKLIVATSDAEDKAIRALHQKGLENDVEGLRWMSGADAIALEPALSCQSALLSAETGILDSHAYMLSLQGALEDMGGVVALNAPALSISQAANGRFLVKVGGTEPVTIAANIVINSAGLYAHRLARTFVAYDDTLLPPFVLAKGNYYMCQTRPAFTRLIYPAPVDGGLGVHVTLDLGGQMRFGPDVEWLQSDNPDEIDYRVDIRRAHGFFDAVRTYWPAMPDGCIAPAYSGVRPKLSGPGQPAADFRIDGPEHHGFDGLVHLFGIESPGLTSSLAIGEEVCRRLNLN